MKDKFLAQASAVKQLLEKRFSKEHLSTDYTYNLLNKLITEVETNHFSASKTDIGQAGIKIFDSGSAEDNYLSNALSELASMYRRLQLSNEFS
ncbi:MAG: hypothetical protein JNL11_02385 [Bdellovibrionaceae bacterium]|nr:hypothetical protein [Pseudobdellovibrionaceae bacterium]